MKKNILLIVGLISIIFFFSCTQNDYESTDALISNKDTLSTHELNNTNSNDKKLDTLLIKSNSVSVLLFKAYGYEPGWFCEIYADKFKLVVDYGKDSLLIEDSFSDLQNTNGFIYKTLDLVFVIKNKSCTAEASGDKMDRTVIITLKNEQYKGCGNFIK